MTAWDRALGALVKRRKIALALSAAVTVVAGIAASGLSIPSDATELLPANAPEVKAWLDLSRRFDALNALMVGLEEPAAPLAREGLEALARVTTRLSELKAGGVLGARSLANFEYVREGDDGSLVNELFMPSIPEDRAGLDALAGRIARDAQVAGSVVSPDGRGYVVIVRADSRKDVGAVAALVRETVEREKGALRAVYFGQPFFTAEIANALSKRAAWLLPGVALFALIGLAAGVRQRARIPLLLGAAAVSMAWWLGGLRLLGIPTSQAALFAGLPLFVIAVAAFARGLESRGASAAGVPLPREVGAALAGLALAGAAMSRLPVALVSELGLSLAVGSLAILLVGLLLFAPVASTLRFQPLPAASVKRFPTWSGALAAVLVISFAGLGGAGARFVIDPRAMFSPDGEVGRAIAFFDERFGGADVVQVGFRGNLRDPAVAGRLLRLTDLLEGEKGVGDVRSVAQVLAFLGKGFGGLRRIPGDQQSLDNLWFFLEGNPDVKSLVSDGRDEAMVVLRVRPGNPIDALLASVRSAVERSAALEATAAKARLLAQAARFGVQLPADRVDRMVAMVERPLVEADRRAVDDKVLARLRSFLASADSPYNPSEDEWKRLASAFALSEGGRKARVIEAAGEIASLKEGGLEAAFVETVGARERDIRLAETSSFLAARLWEGLPQTPPEELQVRAAGIVAELLSPPEGEAAGVEIAVSGMPAVAGVIDGEVRGSLLCALALLLLVGTAVQLLAGGGKSLAVRGLLEGAVATALLVAVLRLSGLHLDAASAPACLLPAALAFVVTGLDDRRRIPASWLLGVACAGGLLLFAGTLPLARLGAVLAIGLVALVGVGRLSRRFAA